MVSLGLMNEFEPVPAKFLILLTLQHSSPSLLVIRLTLLNLLALNNTEVYLKPSEHLRRNFNAFTH